MRRALVGGYLFAPATLGLGRPPRPADPGEGTGRPSPPRRRSCAPSPTGCSRAPALSADEVRRHGADPADPGLIRLDRADGGQQWPAFQFAPGGGPLPVVRPINQLLDAAADPVGVADWWLSRNGWLDEQPSLLLGRAGRSAGARRPRPVGGVT